MSLATDQEPLPLGDHTKGEPGFARQATPWLGLPGRSSQPGTDVVIGWPGFACGHAVAGFFQNAVLKKPGGAERDRTVDLLNAIRGLVVGPGRCCAIGVDSVDPKIEWYQGN